MNSLLGLLVTSEARKKLLQLLWRDEVEASAHQLANLAGGPYSSIHGALEQLVADDLVLKAEAGKTILWCG